MNLTQILAWLSGPAVGSFLSTLLDKFAPWKDWKPEPTLGFDPKAAIVTVGSALLGGVAYTVATTVPAAQITTLDPYVSAAFPLLTFLWVQFWHSKVNIALNKASITLSATNTDGSGVNASMTGGMSVNGDNTKSFVASGSLKNKG